MRMYQIVYHAKKIDIKNADIIQHQKPTQIITQPNYFTVEKAGATGGLAYMQFGSQISNYWTAVANSIYFADTFNIGDLFWLEGTSPDKKVEEEYGIGSSANAIVTNVTIQGRTIVLTLSTNKEQVDV